MANKSLDDIAEQLRASTSASGKVALPAKESGDKSSRLRLTCAADIEPERTDWLWPGYLARGKLAVLAGAPGTGKTTLALSLAATITTEGRWPDKTPCLEHSGVLIWSGEDDAASTLVPRLLAAGADTSRVHFLDGVTEDGAHRPFDPADDIPLIAAALEQFGNISLLIIDPIVSAVKGNAHHANEVRRSLQPIVDYAAKHRCAVIGITHFSKGSAGGNPLERVIGSQAFGALARIVLVAGKSEQNDGERVLARAKSNIGPDDGGVAYSLETLTLEGGIETSRAVWGKCLTGSARDILGDVEVGNDAEPRPLDNAMAFLRDALAFGPVAMNELQKDASGAGHSWGTVRRAKDKLGVIASHPVVPGPWFWSLPDDDGPKVLKKAQDAHSNKVSIMGESEHLGAEAGLLGTAAETPLARS